MAVDHGERSHRVFGRMPTDADANLRADLIGTRKPHPTPAIGGDEQFVKRAKFAIAGKTTSSVAPHSGKSVGSARVWATGHQTFLRNGAAYI